MPNCLSDTFTCLSDILIYLSDILPEKNKMSPTDFKMSLGHLARKKNVSKTSEHVSLKHFPWKMPRCLQDILTCVSYILPGKKQRHIAWKKCQDVSQTSEHVSQTSCSRKKNAKMSPGYLNMSPRHLNMSPRHLNMSPRHLNMSPRHRAVFCIIRSGGTVEGGKK